MIGYMYIEVEAVLIASTIEAAKDELWTNSEILVSCEEWLYPGCRRLRWKEPICSHRRLGIRYSLKI